MFALLGSLVGFASSLLPDVFSMVKDRKDKAHELAILDKQMECMEKGHHNRIAEIGAMADANENQYIYQFAAKSGNSAIDALSTSVRPVLSYAFFMLYAWIKISAFPATVMMSPPLSCKSGQKKTKPSAPKKTLPQAGGHLYPLTKEFAADFKGE